MDIVETINNLIIQGEGLHIEFKQSHDSLSRSAFETICAFLNRKGGHILLGVKDYDDRDYITCNLYQAYYRLLAFIAKHTPDRFYLESYFRISIREMIFREMAANMV